MFGVEFALFKDLSASLQPSQRPRQRCTWEAAQEQVVRADDNINLLEGAGRARQTQTADEEIHFVDRQASGRRRNASRAKEQINATANGRNDDGSYSGTDERRRDGKDIRGRGEGRDDSIKEAGERRVIN